MDRHAAWLTALVVVVAVWLGLLCCAAKSKKSNTARAQRESRPLESMEYRVNGDVRNGPPSETASTMTDVVEQTGNELRCRAEEAREEQDSLSIEAIVDGLHNSTQAKSGAAKVSTESDFEPRSSTGADTSAARRHQQQYAEETQQDENGTKSVVIAIERS